MKLESGLTLFDYSLLLAAISAATVILWPKPFLDGLLRILDMWRHA